MEASDLFLGGTCVLVFVSGLLAILSAGIGAWITYVRTGRAAPGFWLGFFVGPVGWLLALLVADRRPKRPARSVYSATATHSSAETPYCVVCGVDATANAEMGNITYRCPKCGKSL
jgi:hypothetical protein